MIQVKIDSNISYNEYKLFLEKMKNKKNIETFFYSDRNKNKGKYAIQSSLFVTLEKDNEIIGLMKIITDKAYLYYISEVMILPQYQNSGYGGFMMNTFLNYCKQNKAVKVFLTALPELKTYYNKFGFKECEHPVMKLMN